MKHMMDLPLEFELQRRRGPVLERNVVGESILLTRIGIRDYLCERNNRLAAMLRDSYRSANGVHFSDAMVLYDSDRASEGDLFLKTRISHRPNIAVFSFSQEGKMYGFFVKDPLVDLTTRCSSAVSFSSDRELKPDLASPYATVTVGSQLILYRSARALVPGVDLEIVPRDSSMRSRYEVVTKEEQTRKESGRWNGQEYHTKDTSWYNCVRVLVVQFTHLDHFPTTFE